MKSKLEYLSGFGNEFASEAMADVLPVGQNSPQRLPHGLVAEVISGTAFTAPRAENRRTWMYRQKPSVVVGRYEPLAVPYWKTAGVDAASQPTPPEPMRWQPAAEQGESNFVTGMKTVMINGDLHAQIGVSIGLLTINGLQTASDMAFVNSDADMLFVPQMGELIITTELGVLQIEPFEIASVPRGMAFWVQSESLAKAYVCENYGAAFRLPELGPIGSQGLANARDFLAPVAAFDANGKNCPTTFIKKFGGKFWQSSQAHSPFNVVAWHGNLVPFKYDTRRFNTLGSVSFDHPDPSIFTVLTSPSDTAGTANCDFVIFPPRWLVAEHTFRPPWYHRNTMSEMMGLVYGQYDAKEEGFLPGGMSLHNQMVPHGPDYEAFIKASSVTELKPVKLDNTLAFMLESRYSFQLTDYALSEHKPDAMYADCWKKL
jgi:homogentisate 1,2-dioxygenase